METRSTRTDQLAEPFVEPTDSSVNSAALSAVGVSIMESTEVTTHI